MSYVGTKIRLMGAAEIGERLGVSAQRVQQLIWKKGFPEPYQTLRMGSVWDADVIEQWVRENRPHLAQEAGRPEEP